MYDYRCRRPGHSESSFRRRDYALVHEVAGSGESVLEAGDCQGQMRKLRCANFAWSAGKGRGRERERGWEGERWRGGSGGGREGEKELGYVNTEIRAEGVALIGTGYYRGAELKYRYSPGINHNSRHYKRRKCPDVHNLCTGLSFAQNDWGA